MPLRRRSLLEALPLAGAGAALAQDRAAGPRMRRNTGEAQVVQVGAGTQGGVTSGSSGPQKKDGKDNASSGSVSSTQSGGGSQGGRP